jgi:hypothetical protein
MLQKFRPRRINFSVVPTAVIRKTSERLLDRRSSQRSLISGAIRALSSPPSTRPSPKPSPSYEIQPQQFCRLNTPSLIKWR